MSYTAEKYPGERLELVQHVPHYVRDILILGAGASTPGYLLKKKCGATVHAVERDHTTYEVAKKLLDEVVFDTLEDPVSLPKTGGYDALVLLPSYWEGQCLDRVFQLVDSALASDGLLFLYLPNGAYWDAPERSLPQYQDILDASSRHQCLLYRQWVDLDEEFLALEANENGLIEYAGRVFSAEDEAQRISLGSQAYLLLMIRPDYAPLDKARRFSQAKHFDWAYEELELIPEQYLQEADVAGGVACEKIVQLYEMAQDMPKEQLRVMLYRSQKVFYKAMKVASRFALMYQYYAEFWRFCGHQAMAYAVLASFQHLAPDPSVAKQVASLRNPFEGILDYEEAPEWREEQGRPRILFIMHPRLHYGLDVLYDGLCRLLGSENVVDFPYKPSLHGQRPEELKNYPCSFHWQGSSWSMQEVEEALSQGYFDLVLYGDCELALRREDSQRLVRAAGKTPFFIVDQLDEFIDAREWVDDRIEGAQVLGYFKRELVPCLNWERDVFPLPFAYPDDRLPRTLPAERSESLFWAGHRDSGLRRICLEALEGEFGYALDQRYEVEEYAEKLKHSQMGLNLFGFGFDTVRYWELPAHGALLISEHLPIRIPFNFREGSEAVYFRSLPELIEKVRYYREHPQEAARIAAAGRAHLLRYHTGSARARQLLGWIYQRLEAL